MHLLVAHASALAEPARQVLGDLALPHLEQLLKVLVPTARDEADEMTLSPPHERALAAAQGWPVIDGGLPLAAHAAAADGVAVGDLPWGLITPCHWQVGRDHVALADPTALALDASTSRAYLDAVRPLFESEGFTLAWGAPLRWYASHPGLAGLRCASLDRVIGRSVDHWLRSPDTLPGAEATAAMRRLQRRLQSEVQLLLYPHPLNEAREAAGVWTVNSFWLSGCGALPAPAPGEAAPALAVDERLRAPLLQQDWAGWAQAWRELDAGPLRELRQAQGAGKPVQLTLCGERAAQTFEAQPQALWSRLRRRFASEPAHMCLEAL